MHNKPENIEVIVPLGSWTNTGQTQQEIPILLGDYVTRTRRIIESLESRGGEPATLMAELPVTADHAPEPLRYHFLHHDATGRTRHLLDTTWGDCCSRCSDQSKHRLSPMERNIVRCSREPEQNLGVIHRREKNRCQQAYLYC